MLRPPLSGSSSSAMDHFLLPVLRRIKPPPSSPSPAPESSHHLARMGCSSAVEHLGSAFRGSRRNAPRHQGVGVFRRCIGGPDARAAGTKRSRGISSIASMMGNLVTSDGRTWVSTITVRPSREIGHWQPSVRSVPRQMPHPVREPQRPDCRAAPQRLPPALGRRPCASAGALGAHPRGSKRARGPGHCLARGGGYDRVARA